MNIDASGISRVSVYDVYGQIIIEKAENCNVIQIDLDGFAKGQYIVQVNTVNGVFVKKIIKE